MRRRACVILCVAAWAAALACVAGAVASRGAQRVLMSEAGKPGFAVGLRLFDRHAFLSWKPAAEFRPPWAGQINRNGFRYTRWSNGSAEVGGPLWVPAVLLGAVGIGAAAAAWRTRRNGSP